MLKIYDHGYLNRVQSSRRLEREAQRNVELIWLTGRPVPAFEAIADQADREPVLVTEISVGHIDESKSRPSMRGCAS